MAENRIHQHHGRKRKNRDSHRKQQLLIRKSGTKCRRMFSTKLVEGASKVAEEHDLIADTCAPKKRI